MDNREEVFAYTYSAGEQSEVERIRRKYLPQEEDKMEQLRRLDRLPHQRAQSISLCFGIIGALILGMGMSLVMTELGEILRLPGNSTMPLGILIGIVGLVLVALAYPAYNRILKKEQARIAPEILRLTEELLK